MTSEQTTAVNSGPEAGRKVSADAGISSIDTNAGTTIAVGDERKVAAADRLSRVLSELCAEGNNALVTFMREAKLNGLEATAGIAFSSGRRSEAVIEIQQALRHYAETNGRQKEIADTVRQHYKGASKLTDEQALERFVDGVPGKATFELVEKMASALKWPGLSTRNYKILESSDKECKPKDVSVRIIPVGLLEQFRQYIELNCPPKKQEGCLPCDPCPPPSVPVKPEPPKIVAPPPESTPEPKVGCSAQCVLDVFEATIKRFDPAKPEQLDGPRSLYSTLKGSNAEEISKALVQYSAKHGHSFLWDFSKIVGAPPGLVTTVANKIYAETSRSNLEESKAVEDAGQLFKLFRGFTNSTEEQQARELLNGQDPKQLELLERTYNEVYGSGTGRFANLRSLIRTELGRTFYERLFGAGSAASLARTA